MGDTNIFMTGGTGFLGRRLALSILQQNPRAVIWFLVRGNRKGSAEDRFKKILHSIAAEAGLTPEFVAKRAFLVKGELVSPQFGLSEFEFKDLARKTNCIYHAAASVRFDLSYEKASRVNIGGTLSTLDLAEQAQNLGGLERFNYVSTAYVAGKRKGIVYEHELEQGQTFNNTYEATKLASEKLVRKSMHRFPATIFRPSIVMGDSQSGRTETFNVVYAPIKWGYMAKLAVVPGCRRSKIDTVPVDYVTRAITYLSGLNDEVIGKTYHLTVGQGRTISVRDLVESSSRYLIELIDRYGLKNPKRVPAMLHPQVFRFLGIAAEKLSWGARRRLFKQLNTYVPYTLFYKEFNNDAARALLEPAGIVCPRLQDYLSTLCKYCVETHFGTSTHPMDVV